MLVDNGLAVNILPYKMLNASGETEADLIVTKTVATFNGKVSKTIIVLQLEITIRSKTYFSAFFVVNSIDNVSLLSLSKI